MDRFIIKRNIYRLYRRNLCLLMCAVFCLFAGCNNAKDKDSSAKSEISSAGNTSLNSLVDSNDNVNEIEAFEDLDESCTRTYISMPTETEEQQFEVIKARLSPAFSVAFQDFPKPQKIENFTNNAKSLFCTASFLKEDIDELKLTNPMIASMMKENNPEIELDLSTESYKAPDWWDVGPEDLPRCMFACIFPTSYAYKDSKDVVYTSQHHFLIALEIEDSDMCRVYFGCQTGLPDRLVDNPECYRD